MVLLVSSSQCCNLWVTLGALVSMATWLYTFHFHAQSMSAYTVAFRVLVYSLSRFCDPETF